MSEYILWVSAFFMLSGALGLLKLPDVYNRIHATTLITFGGAVLGLLALAIKSYPTDQIAAIKMLLLIGLILLASPTSSHMIANAAYKKGIKPVGVKKHAPA